MPNPTPRETPKPQDSPRKGSPRKDTPVTFRDWASI